MEFCNFEAVCVLNSNILGMVWKRMGVYAIMNCKHINTKSSKKDISRYDSRYY